MDRPVPYEVIRDWVEGRLDPGARSEFESALAADPALRAAAEEYRAVHAWTDVPGEPVPPSAVTFDALPLGDGSPWTTAASRWGLAAAATLLVGLSLWWFVGRDAATGGVSPGDGADDATGPVHLSVIHLAEPEGPPPPKAVADYVPVRDGTVKWFAVPAEAREVARFARRPVFVYGMFPGCPWCQEMDRTSLVDPEVLAVVPRFVPVRVDFGTLARPEIAEYMRRGWPYFAVEDADGNVLQAFPGRQDAATLRKNLETALARVPSGEGSRDWSEVREDATRALRAREARDAIVAAREAPRDRPFEAQAALAREVERLAGTAEGEDLRRVLARWRRDGEFPAVEEVR